MSIAKRIMRLALGTALMTPTLALAGSFYMGPLVQYSSMSKNGASYQAVRPNLSVGYGEQLNNSFYLAGEVFAGPRSFAVKNSPSSTVSLRTTYNYGASILPGYLIDNVVMVYARLSVMKTRFDNLGVIKRAYSYGGGLEGCLTPNWSLRGEYNYATYDSIGGVGRIKDGQYAIGLKYTFL